MTWKIWKKGYFLTETWEKLGITFSKVVLFSKRLSKGFKGFPKYKSKFKGKWLNDGK